MSNSISSSKAIQAVVYRLRNRGYHIDTKQRTIFTCDFTCAKDFPEPDRRMVERLLSEFHFVLQVEISPSAHGRVYISGPIAHYDIEERMQVFDMAAKLIRAAGYLPVNPFNNELHRSGRADADWREHMKADIKMLLNCQYIYMLPDWELSKGCKLELDVASSCGIKVLYPPH